MNQTENNPLDEHEHLSEGDRIKFTYESARSRTGTEKTRSGKIQTINWINFRGAKIFKLFLYDKDNEKFYKIIRTLSGAYASSSTTDPTTNRSTRLGQVQEIEVENDE